MQFGPLRFIRSAVMPLLIGAVVVLPLVAAPTGTPASFGSASSLSGDWQFSLTQQAVSDPALLSTDAEHWQVVQIPHDWSVKGKLSPELSSCTGFLPGGVGWYRKDIHISSAADSGNQVYLYFEGVYNRSDVYINGHHLGHRPNGYISFLYDATPHVKFGETNTIAVRVDHSRQADSRWYTGSGIYRDVWLIRSHPVHIAQWGVFAHATDISAEDATLHISTDLVNGTDSMVDVILHHELKDASGQVVARGQVEQTIKEGGAATALSAIRVQNPELWDLERPYLYELNTRLEYQGKTVDRNQFKTGFRTLGFCPDTGFSLNGRNMKMKGVCLHHDAGVLGSAVPREVWRKRLITLKSIGTNAIRTSHNPQATDLYELCDELGLLVMNEAFDEWEFPKRKWIEGWNVGTPGFQGSYDFFEEWAERDVADMVRRDRNHISIFAWSIGNEVDYPNDPYSHPVLDGSEISQPMFGGYKPESPDANRLGGIAKRLVAAVKELDTSRPVTAALAGVVMSNATEYPFVVDIAGYNYTEKRYAIDHETYPERVLFGSETRHDYDAWRAVVDNDYVFGQFLWTGIDYLGESGAWPSRGFYSGLLDFGGYLKPRGYFREALWSEQPVLTLGTTSAPADDEISIDAWPVWSYEEGELVRVYCYTNAAEVQLMLNGKAVGDRKPYDVSTGVLYWDIPFAAGELIAEGYDKDGNRVSRDRLVTHGAASAMKLRCDTPAVSADRGLAMVELLVVDGAGNRVMDAAHEVTCAIEGPARLLGLEASNNEDMSDYTDATHAVFQGRILAYIQASGQEGDIKVTFSAAGLNPVSMMVAAKTVGFGLSSCHQ